MYGAGLHYDDGPEDRPRSVPLGEMDPTLGVGGGQPAEHRTPSAASLNGASATNGVARTGAHPRLPGQNGAAYSSAEGTPKQYHAASAAMDGVAPPQGVGAAAAAGPMQLSREPIGRPRKVLGDVILRLKNVSKTFQIAKSDEVVHALEDISLCESAPGSATITFPPIRQGEFVMIRGPSGGGKTTLLNIIGTIDSPTSGTVELLGERIDSSSDDDYLSDLRLKHLGFVFQTFNLLATMSALENVELPMTLLGNLSAEERKRRAKQLLALVGLRNRAGHLPSELSGGEQQRTTIARSLANNPAILLLDEPTGDLDTTTTIDVMDLLMRINHLAGTTCIMVTHNPDVECYADRILYVEDGRFVRQVINELPVPLIKEDYAEYLKKMDGPAPLRGHAAAPGHGVPNGHAAAPATAAADPFGGTANGVASPAIPSALTNGNGLHAHYGADTRGRVVDPTADPHI